MKESPILFSGEMVKAILEGRKTQTRRVIKCDVNLAPHWFKIAFKDGIGDWVFYSEDWPGLEEETKNDYPKGGGYPCPYGKPGDRLWVRETFVLEQDDLEGDTPVIPTDRPHFHHPGGENEFDNEYYLFPHYRATDPTPELMYEDRDEPTCKWRPSIFMPRWASRILLEVVNVRVERVQDISEQDAKTEGIPLVHNAYGTDRYEIWTGTKNSCNESAKNVFIDLWDSINTKRGYGWDVNPWVWVIEFKRMVQE